MPKFQCVTTPYPEETGGLLRLNGRHIPIKRAVYSEETGGWLKRPGKLPLPSRPIPRKRAYRRECSDQNCIAPRIVVGAGP